jgi:RNA polymerase sigma-70 factor (ECF subfamily)
VSTAAERTDEVELLARARAGDRHDREEAFAEIHRRLEPGLWTVCRRMCGDAEDAEDALQETFLALHHTLASFRGEARLSTYAYRIAVRVCLRRRAADGRRAHRPLEVEPGARPTDPAREHELADALDAAVAALRPEYRAVFSLCSLEELGAADVARILGLPEGTVWTRLHRARKELARRLAPVLE